MASAKYQRRIERGLARGLTRSQARGHPRPGERLVRAKRLATDDKLEAALKALRINGNQAMAAKSAGVSVERFRRFLRENRIAERQGRRWRITDPRPRQVVIISIRGERQITVSGFDASSLVMLHRDELIKE
jgi:hypothetical protein